MSSASEAPGVGDASERQESTDKADSDCFFCQGYTDYHPICDRPGCENLTHGFGSEGKRTLSNCSEHSSGAS